MHGEKVNSISGRLTVLHEVGVVRSIAGCICHGQIDLLKDTNCHVKIRAMHGELNSISGKLTVLHEVGVYECWCCEIAGCHGQVDLLKSHQLQLNL